MSKTRVGNFVDSLIAVVAGNAVYFLLMPPLPESARHISPHLDLGLVVDFWFCLVMLGIVKTVGHFKAQLRTPKR